MAGPAFEKTACVIGTAGHIDHGKTSLVRALTGMDTDRLAEEKRRGVSIDLGFAHLDFETAGKKFRVSIVDVPGHERFIKNMLAGTTGMDAVLFVVAADDGVMPQTREHLDIVRLLGIGRAIFVITKKDLVPAERVEEVKREVEGLIAATPLEGSPFIALSATTGEGIEELKDLIASRLAKPREGELKGFFRLPVDRSFSVKGFGAVVTGTVACGKVARGDELIDFPSGCAIKVRGIQSLFSETDSVSAGERAAINLSGMSHNDISRGHILASPELAPFVEYARNGRPLAADCFLELIPGIRPVKDRALLTVHHLTDETLATVRFNSGKEARAGERLFCRLILKKPLMMLRGDRFIVRDPSINSTIGGGVVHLPYLSRRLMPKLTGLKTPEQGQTLDKVFSQLIPQNGVAVDINSASMMLNASASELSERVENSPLVTRGGFIARKDSIETLERDIINSLSSFHNSNPLDAGMREEILINSFIHSVSPGLGKRLAFGFLKEFLEELAKKGAIRREGGLVRLPSHRATSKGADTRVEGAIRGLFSKGFTSVLAEDIRKLPFQKTEADKVLNFLLREGTIVRLKEGTYLSGEAIKEAREKLSFHIKSKGPIKAAEFRDLLGCGRKLAIEILEYFDRERVTLRGQGDARVLRQ